MSATNCKWCVGRFSSDNPGYKMLECNHPICCRCVDAMISNAEFTTIPGEDAKSPLTYEMAAKCPACKIDARPTVMMPKMKKPPSRQDLERQFKSFFAPYGSGPVSTKSTSQKKLGTHVEDRNQASDKTSKKATFNHAEDKTHASDKFQKKSANNHEDDKPRISDKSHKKANFRHEEDEDDDEPRKPVKKAAVIRDDENKNAVQKAQKKPAVSYEENKPQKTEKLQKKSGITQDEDKLHSTDKSHKKFSHENEKSHAVDKAHKKVSQGDEKLHTTETSFQKPALNHAMSEGKLVGKGNFGNTIVLQMNPTFTGTGRKEIPDAPPIHEESKRPRKKPLPELNSSASDLKNSDSGSEREKDLSKTETSSRLVTKAQDVREKLESKSEKELSKTDKPLPARAVAKPETKEEPAHNSKKESSKYEKGADKGAKFPQLFSKTLEKDESRSEKMSKFPRLFSNGPDSKEAEDSRSERESSKSEKGSTLPRLFSSKAPDTRDTEDSRSERDTAKLEKSSTLHRLFNSKASDQEESEKEHSKSEKGSRMFSSKAPDTKEKDDREKETLEKTSLFGGNMKTMRGKVTDLFARIVVKPDESPDPEEEPTSSNQAAEPVNISAPVLVKRPNTLTTVSTVPVHKFDKTMATQARAPVKRLKASGASWIDPFAPMDPTYEDVENAVNEVASRSSAAEGNHTPEFITEY